MRYVSGPQLQFTRDARRLIVAGAERVTVHDRSGGRGELAVAADAIAAFADQVWTVSSAGLQRWTLDGREIGEADDPRAVRGGALIAALAGPAAARWGEQLWLDDLGSLRASEIGPEALPFAGRRVLAPVRQRGELRVQLGTVQWALPAGAQLVGGGALFDGAGVVMVIDRGDVDEVWVAAASGALHHKLELPAGELRVAPRRGLAVIADGDRLSVLDLRLGRIAGVGGLAVAPDDLAIDHDGRLLAVRSGDGVEIVELAEVLRARPASRSAASPPMEAAPEAASPGAADHAPSQRAEAREAPVPDAREAVPEAREAARSDAREAVPEAREAGLRDAREAVPDAPVRARLVRPLALPALAPRAQQPAVPRPVALKALERELQLVAAWTYGAIARDWDSRRLGYANESAHPHEHEVAAILGKNAGFATELRAIAHDELCLEQAQIAAPGRRGPDTVLGQLAAELGLSPLAIDILLVVAAPAVWGDLARLYGILANDPGRPVVDELLLQHLLAPRASRHDIARELDARAPLVQAGVLEVGARARPFAPLAVDPVVIARLRAEPPDLGAAVAVRVDGPALDDVDVPAGVLGAALAQLARPQDRPVRIVGRGRPGAGRRTLLAALAREAGRPLAVIDATLLPRVPDAFAAALRTLLRRIHLAGLLPCVTQLDAIGFGERDVADVAGETLRAHPGPLALVLGPSAIAPLDPGYLAIDLPVLAETERLALWRRALAGAGRWVRDPDGLAARYRVGPGVIHKAIAALAELDPADDATAAIEGFIRQARDARLAQIATRVDRLASWANLVLPADVLDSLRELIARVRHRRTVFEHWGLGETLTTARGLTALFSGPPGTGKTLVAGVIARELGLDLYQVDLSKVMSKWIGETERNLATVFDAAEDGQVILLFDEADSLFAKRTEVRSSNDRYANLEVNYLLQRLDVFEGIAILTTNFGTSIDPAFKRRLSFRLSFPFPDEDTRTQLWRAHLPPRLPVAGALALDRLAHKYQLSGGYIRNACLRAAFLAAQDEAALSQHHLERAVALEYAELGKLSSSGAID